MGQRCTALVISRFMSRFLRVIWLGDFSWDFLCPQYSNRFHEGKMAAMGGVHARPVFMLIDSFRVELGGKLELGGNCFITNFGELVRKFCIVEMS